MARQVHTFDEDFAALSGFRPFAWQRRLFESLYSGDVPVALDLPTGLGKTSVIAIWLIARAHGAKLPRRLAYVVDRRAVVDQATEEVIRLRANLRDLSSLKERLCLGDGGRLPISTLRGRFVDNREWLADPATPAIVIGTVDMIGSRVLFSGYGISRKLRPYHAGLLGADTLVVLDEAHLVPAFERLLESIEGGREVLGPIAGEPREIVPAFQLLSLSATGRERKGKVFRLSDSDTSDVERRLKAQKRITIVSAGDRTLDSMLADQAWSVAQPGTSHARCLVYCDSRDIAEKTEKAIRKRADGDRKKGVASIEVATELFVGARRAKERDDAKAWLETHGFLAGSPPPPKPAFLIATSAGEVGVDLDADHMVCDVVPWERMVQRLGRVNRRGGGDARILIIDRGKPSPKKPEAPTDSEQRAMIAYRVLPIIGKLPATEEGFDASPGALRELKLRAERDGALKKEIDDATTPAPLRPALTRALVDAWSLTSLEEHSGRPDIAPWLRGWSNEDEPQTSVVWRTHLPIRKGEDVTEEEVEGYFEAAPPHASESLDTETRRVVEWLLERARAAVRPEAPMSLKLDDTIAFTLTPAREIKRKGRDERSLAYTVSDFIPEGQAPTRFKDRLGRELAGATLIVDARIGGLSSTGLLDPGVGDPATTADDGKPDWLPDDEDGRPAVGFRVHPHLEPGDTAIDKVEALVFATERSEDGRDEKVHLVETWTTEESRAASIRAQLLDEHQFWTETAAARIAEAVNLTGDYARVLRIAARLHDEGKKAIRWQRAFRAPPGGVYAKTKGPLNLSHLDGYRHEFGSLPWVEREGEFQKLPDDLKDLVLHLVAAHHGFARPLIGIRACDDAPPSILQDRARDIALRFARLQNRWGPWGLAWWEALLRAADQQASRRNDEEGKRTDG